MLGKKGKDDESRIFINPWGKKYTLPPGGISEYYPSSLLDGLSPQQYQLFLDGKWPPPKNNKRKSDKK